MQHKCVKTKVHHFILTFLLLALCLCNSWGWFPNKKQSRCHFAWAVDFFRRSENVNEICGLSLFPSFSLNRRFFFRRSDKVFRICGSICKKGRLLHFAQWWRLQIFGSASVYQISAAMKNKKNHIAVSLDCLLRYWALYSGNGGKWGSEVYLMRATWQNIFMLGFHHYIHIFYLASQMSSLYNIQCTEWPYY